MSTPTDWSVLSLAVATAVPEKVTAVAVAAASSALRMFFKVMDLSGDVVWQVDQDSNGWRWR
jgi:hypothetical protein